MEGFRGGSENMNKKYMAIMLIVTLALAFSAGCVQTAETKQNTTTATPAQKEINQSDNLEPALQELEELEGL